MKKKSKRPLTPKLRFPEFRDEGEWEEKILGSVFTSVSNGLALDQSNNNSGYKVTRIETISNKIIDITKVGYVQTEQDISPYKLSLGDILFSNINSISHIGKVAFVDDEYDLYHGMNLLRLVPDKKSNDPRFLYYQLDTRRLKSSFEERANKAINQASINQTELRKTIVFVPLLSEQQKITECLSSLDGLIAAEGRMLEALKAHKKGLMQQLFPQPGQTQPRLRFPEFRDKGEWVEEKLSRHIKLVSGMHLSPSDYNDHGQIPYFTGPSDFTNAESHVSKWTTQTDNKGVAHDILITVKGSGVGELWYLELPQAALGRQLMAVRPSNGINRFYFQLLLSKRRLFEDLAMGNLIPGLSRGDILNLKTPLPIEAEQRRIADCLTSLDDRLAAQTAKIEALKQHKRGLMQQLFPAPEEN